MADPQLQAHDHPVAGGGRHAGRLDTGDGVCGVGGQCDGEGCLCGADKEGECGVPGEAGLK